jgi:hypothetical protein
MYSRSYQHIQGSKPERRGAFMERVDGHQFLQLKIRRAYQNHLANLPKILNTLVHTPSLSFQIIN